MNQPKVTVIIVAYNAEGIRNIFKKCLDSTLNLKYDNYEVIVVNNGSTDRTREILQNYEKDLKVINLKRNIGAAGARNIAYENSKSELVLLLDSDVIPEQDSLKELVKIGMKNNKIGALSGIQVDYKKTKITNLGGLIGIYGHDIFPDSIPSINEIKESYYSFIHSAFLLVKRKVIGNILHPKDFFMYYEDHELCFRIWSRGYHIKLYPIVVCSHEFKTSVKAASKKDPYLIRILNYCTVKNSTLVFSSIYKKFLPRIYLIRLLESILYPPIIEIIHFPRYFFIKNNYNFIGAYYPSISLTYLKYFLKRLSTINEYGNYVPLLLKLNNSKNILTPSKNIFGQIIIKLDYEKTIINDEDLLKSSRKFIISR